MSRWQDIHSVRARQFLELLADIVAPATSVTSPRVMPPGPKPPEAPALPAPKPAAASPSESGTRPTAPTAASVFKHIPWKK